MRRRIKRKIIIILIIAIILIISSIMVFKYVKHINSIPYKLEKIGYNEKEIEIITSLDNNKVNDILNY